MTETVAILGAGNMGTALGHVIASNGHRAVLWSIETDVLEEIRDHHRNTKYLAGIELSPRIEARWEIADAVADASLVFMTVPSQIVAKVAADVSPHLAEGVAVLNVAKGLEAGSHKRMSQVISDGFGGRHRSQIGSMGGPAIAIEMARGHPMAVIVGYAEPAPRRHVQRVLQNEHLKVEATADLIGLELCATLKNIYAISLGMCDGLGLGMNTKAFVGTVAVEEMMRICTALGGLSQTAYGLAGLGDLLTTGYSEHSRNRTLGDKLGSGADWQRFLLESTVEGVVACKAIKELTRESAEQFPLLATVHAVLFEKRSAPEGMRSFLREFSF